MEKEEVVYLVVFSLLVFFAFLLCLMSAIAIFYRRNKRYSESLVEFNYKKEQQLLQSQVEVQEATLNTLSKDLHDNVGQLLSTAKMLLGITERSIENPPDTLKTANATLGEAINELRSLSKSLSKEWLEQFNLIENLTNEVNRINTDDGVKLHLSYANEISLKADEQIILFRIIQEAIQNAIKHAAAKNIDVNIFTRQQVLFASVTDDGSGFDDTCRPAGVGIMNMKHRAKLLGGTINWESSGQGCNVLITLPINKEGV